MLPGVSKWRHFCACTLVPSAKEEQPSNIQKLWSKRRTALSQSLLMALEGLFLSVKFGLKIFVYHWIWYLMQGCSSFCPSAMNRDWDFTTSDHDLRAVLLFEMGPKYKCKNDATCSSWWLFFYIPWIEVTNEKTLNSYWIQLDEKTMMDLPLDGDKQKPISHKFVQHSVRRINCGGWVLTACIEIDAPPPPRVTSRQKRHILRNH